MSNAIIGEIDEDIRVLKEQISHLQSKVDALEAKKANYMSYIAPLRRVPTEILGHIVDFCILSGIQLVTLTQICGSIRDAVIAMKTQWRRICLLGPKEKYYPFDYVNEYAKRVQQGVVCNSAEQLAVILSRAQSGPLDLFIQLALRPEDVNLLLLQSPLVQSLTIFCPWSNSDVDLEFFHRLDFSLLKRLHFIHLHESVVQEILNLVSKFPRENLVIHCDHYHSSQIKDFLSHSLIQKVTELSISHPAGTWDTALRQMVPNTINIPSVISCHFEIHPYILSSINLASVRSMSFTSSDPTVPIRPASIPHTLTRLTLSRARLRPIAPSTHRPQPLPELKILEIKNTKIVGSIGQHFIVPNLCELTVSHSVFYRYLGNTSGTEEKQSERCISTGDISKLEHLTLESVSLGSDLFQRLQDCDVLREIKVNHCYDINFVDRFTSLLKEGDRLPRLQSLHVGDTRTRHSSKSSQELTVTFAAERPHLTISGNGMTRHINSSFMNAKDDDEESSEEDSEAEEDDPYGLNRVPTIEGYYEYLARQFHPGLYPDEFSGDPYDDYDSEEDLEDDE